MNDNKYTLPVASAETLGGIKLGEGLSADENGVVSASGGDVLASDVLMKTNTTPYTPTNDYNPATKKYVDDSISTALGTIETTLQTINNGSGV